MGKTSIFGSKIPEAYKMYAFRNLVPDSLEGEERRKLYQEFKRIVDTKFAEMHLVVIYPASNNFQQFFYRFPDAKKEIIIKRKDGKITMFMKDDFHSNKDPVAIDIDEIFS